LELNTAKHKTKKRKATEEVRSFIYISEFFSSAILGIKHYFAVAIN
jgi:hypothetical protein